MSSELLLDAGSLLTVLLNRCPNNVEDSESLGQGLCFLCNHPSNSYESKLFRKIRRRTLDSSILKSMKLSQANSLCELFHLESLPSTLKKRLLYVNYCEPCFELISEVDYFNKLASTCNRKLGQFKNDVETLLISAATGAEPPGAKRVKIEPGASRTPFKPEVYRRKAGPKCSRATSTPRPGKTISTSVQFNDDEGSTPAGYECDNYNDNDPEDFIDDFDTQEEPEVVPPASPETNVCVRHFPTSPPRPRKRKSQSVVASGSAPAKNDLDTNKLVHSLTSLQASFERTEKELRASNQRLQRLETELVTVKGKLDTNLNVTTVGNTSILTYEQQFEVPGGVGAGTTTSSYSHGEEASPYPSDTQTQNAVSSITGQSTDRPFVSLQVENRILELKLPEPAISKLVGLTKTRSVILFILRQFYTIQFLRSCNLTGMGIKKAGKDTIHYVRETFPPDMVLLITEAIKKLFPATQNPNSDEGRQLIKQQQIRTKRQLSALLQYFKDAYNDDGTLKYKISKSRANKKRGSANANEYEDEEEYEEDSN